MADDIIIGGIEIGNENEEDIGASSESGTLVPLENAYSGTDTKDAGLIVDPRGIKVEWTASTATDELLKYYIGEGYSWYPENPWMVKLNIYIKLRSTVLPSHTGFAGFSAQFGSEYHPIIASNGNQITVDTSSIPRDGEWHLVAENALIKYAFGGLSGISKRNFDLSYGNREEGYNYDSITLHVTYGGNDYTTVPYGSFNIGSIQQHSASVNYSFTGAYGVIANISTYPNTTITPTTPQQSLSDNSYVTKTDSYSLSDLSPNSAYQVTMKIDSPNRKSYSETQRFATLPIYVTGISQDTININKGDTLVLSPTITPSNASIKELTLTSSNESVFTVNNTRKSVTGKNAGTATLTLKATDTAGGHTPVFISVNVVVGIYAETIATERTALRVTSTPQKIQYSVYPSGSTDTEVVFTSSDTSVCTVDTNGYVTAVSDGKAYITLDVLSAVDGAVRCSTTINIIASNTREWIDLSVPDYVSFSFVDDYYNNLAVISSIDPGIQLSVPQTSGNETPPHEILSILNTVESDITTIYNTIKNLSAIIAHDIASIYISHQTWSNSVNNVWARIKRWVDFANETYEALKEYESDE